VSDFGHTQSGRSVELPAHSDAEDAIILRACRSQHEDYHSDKKHLETNAGRNGVKQDGVSIAIWVARKTLWRNLCARYAKRDHPPAVAEEISQTQR